MFYNQQVENDCAQIISSISLKKFNQKKILILGSNSFLASYIIAVLTQANHDLKLKTKLYCCSKNKPHSIFEEIYKKNKNFIDFKKIDLERVSNFKKKILNKKYDFIFHCATYGQPEKWLNNFSSTTILNTVVLEELIKYSIKNKSRLMYFSSADVYEKNTSGKLINEKSKLGSPEDSYRSIYSLSKIMGEKICKYYEKNHKYKTYVVRPGHTYGPGQTINDKRFISQVLKRALYEKKVYIFGNGKSIKTWCYISEVTSMIFNVIQFGKSNIYNLVGKDFISVEEIAKEVAKQTNVKFFKKKIKNQFVSKDYSQVKLSSKKYHGEFKKKLKNINLSNGLNKFIKWSKGSITKR
jgi:dTDP-glucose 4,6-dehydratase/UDP-glucuronate decarboxylase